MQFDDLFKPVPPPPKPASKNDGGIPDPFQIPDLPQFIRKGSFMTTANPTQIESSLRSIESLLGEILAELRSKPAPAQSAARTPTSSSGDHAGGPVPQPSHLVDSPGSVVIHFGKNAGKQISELGDRSLSWYAAEQAPRLRDDGTPFPPRPQDLTLRNACRQLFHERKGTLAAQAATPAEAPIPAQAAAPVDEENGQF